MPARWKDAGTIFFSLSEIMPIKLSRWNEANSFFAPHCALEYFMKMRACYQPIWMCFLFVKCSPLALGIDRSSISLTLSVSLAHRLALLTIFFSVGEKWPCVSLESSWHTLIWNVTEAYMHERGFHDVCDAYTVWVSKAIVYTNTTTEHRASGCHYVWFKNRIEVIFCCCCCYCCYWISTDDANFALGAFFLCRTPNSIAVFFFRLSIHSFTTYYVQSTWLFHLPFFHFIVVSSAVVVVAVDFICVKRVIAICLFCHYWEFIGIT